MIESKGWNWKAVEGQNIEYWQTPSAESYYLLHRWKERGFERFLDLGCGLGRHSVLFGLNGYDVFALDLNEDAIERTKEWATSLGLDFDCRIGDMLALPYENGSLDCILCMNVIAHTDTDGVRRAIFELKRVLKPGGECYLTLGSKSSRAFRQDWPEVDENTKLFMVEGPEYKVPHFYADRELICDLFSDFEIVSVRHIEGYFERDGEIRSSYHYHVLVKKI